MWQDQSVLTLDQSLFPAKDLGRELAEVYVEAHFWTHRLATNPVVDWFVSRGRLDEFLLLENLLTRPEILAAFEEVESTDIPAGGFQYLSPFKLGGTLAAAYYSLARERRSGQFAKNLGEKAADLLIGGDFDHTYVFYGISPWCDFFFGQGFDPSWVIVDSQKRLIHTIVATGGRFI